MKTALITGITGQDGSYLAELLLDKGYEVYGIVRRSSTTPYERIAHLVDRIELLSADLLDQLSLVDAIADVRAATRSTTSRRSPSCRRRGTSRCSPASSPRMGVTRVLEAIRQVDAERRASTRLARARCSARCARRRRPRSTPFYPRSPYGVAKVYGHWITVNYRESYDLFAVSGILFNHEIAAARPRVRDAQGHRRRRAHQARARHRSCDSATSTRGATGALPATTSTRCGGCCSRTSRTTS